MIQPGSHPTTVGPWADAVRFRPLVRNDRLRPFRHRGQMYAHTSAVPLSYLAATPALISALESWSTPALAADVLGGELTSDDAAFVATLLNVGILADADTPDAIHEIRPDPSAVATLMLYPNNSCNLRCVYCYATSGPNAGPRLSREQALMAVDDFFATLDDRVRAVILGFHGGGEPTTNFTVMLAAWESFRAHAADRHLKAAVRTITNGTFGSTVLRTLARPEWQVLVSYDGPRQAAQRPTAADWDSRERVVANLRALRAAGKAVTTRATLTREGLPYLGALVDDALEIGITRVQVEAASIVGRGSNLRDGPPDPLEFAEAFLDAFYYGLGQGLQLHTAGWSHTRVGDGRYCGAITGRRALTPDGFVSACTEACDGTVTDDPFIVGRLDTERKRLEIWPVREATLAERVGYHLPHCRTCYMVDTCAGGCASKSRAETGNILDRDHSHCVVSRRVNPEIMAALADGRLLPDPGWQPIEATLAPGQSVHAGMSGRVVAMVPPFARARWNAAPSRRPLFPATAADRMFFHLPTAS